MPPRPMENPPVTAKSAPPSTDAPHHAPVAVLGAGAWGTALAVVLGRNGIPVRLWGHRPETIQALAANRVHERHLPGVPLPESVQPVESLDEALESAAWTLMVVPSHAFRETLQIWASAWRRQHNQAPDRLAWATKGLDATSGGLLHQVVRAEVPEVASCAVVSGPSFAREVGAGLPTAVAVAAEDPAFGACVAGALHQPRFRTYTSNDLIGVELGGAVKNVLAVATGICDGLALGANARAALVTRGLAEIGRLGQRLGADPLTLMGLAGVGDVLLTCTDDQSRNRRFGLGIGQGLDAEAAERAVGSTVEAVRTARELAALASAQGVDMPIAATVHAVLQGRLDATQAVEALLEREPRAEFE